MTSSEGRLSEAELAAVGENTQEELLRALEVAIHVEETLNVVLPDSVLNPACLGTPQSVARTVAELAAGH